MANNTTGSVFENLVNIMSALRGPDGCPWDREQTHGSLKQYLIEEAYEVLEVLDEENDQELCNELGDLLLQIIFHAQIASENQKFDITDVIETISEKLIRRHPNVFGDVKIDTAEQQSVNWEKIKKSEGKKSVIDGVPKAMPALLRASRIQQKAATVGFDWPDKQPVWDKVNEELGELKEAVEKDNKSQIEEEFGDFLFSLVNLSRFLDVNPEDALKKTTDKFSERFQKVENHFEAKGENINEKSLEEMDSVWNEIKIEEHKAKRDKL